MLDIVAGDGAGNTCGRRGRLSALHPYFVRVTGVNTHSPLRGSVARIPQGWDCGSSANGGRGEKVAPARGWAVADWG